MRIVFRRSACTCTSLRRGAGRICARRRPCNRTCATGGVLACTHPTGRMASGSIVRGCGGARRTAGGRPARARDGSRPAPRGVHRKASAHRAGGACNLGAGCVGYADGHRRRRCSGVAAGRGAERLRAGWRGRQLLWAAEGWARPPCRRGIWDYGHARWRRCVCAGSARCGRLSCAPRPAVAAARMPAVWRGGSMAVGEGCARQAVAHAVFGVRNVRAPSPRPGKRRATLWGGAQKRGWGCADAPVGLAAHRSSLWATRSFTPHAPRLRACG